MMRVGEIFPYDLIDCIEETGAGIVVSHFDILSILNRIDAMLEKLDE